MAKFEQALSQTFTRFFASKKAGAMVLIICTVISLALANSTVSRADLGFWHHHGMKMVSPEVVYEK